MQKKLTYTDTNTICVPVNDILFLPENLIEEKWVMALRWRKVKQPRGIKKNIDKKLTNILTLFVLINDILFAWNFKINKWVRKPKL